MQTTRREFMCQVGVTLAGLLLSGCDLASQLITPTPTIKPPLSLRPDGTDWSWSCYIPILPTETPTRIPATLSPMPSDTPPPALQREERWRALRVCWLDLRDARLQLPENMAFSYYLRRQHMQALQVLVANKELPADIADEISTAFVQAIAHIQRKMVTCYEPLQPGEANPYPPREEVITQAAALTEMAGRSNIDSNTVARAREVLARDMAWLAQFQASKQPVALESVEATPAEVEAARTLVELLLAKK